MTAHLIRIWERNRYDFRPTHTKRPTQVGDGMIFVPLCSLCLHNLTSVIADKTWFVEIYYILSAETTS